MGAPRSTVDLLAVKGDDVGWRDEDGATALHWATMDHCVELVRALVRTHGANLDAQNSGGSSPLALHSNQRRDHRREVVAAARGGHLAARRGRLYSAEVGREGGRAATRPPSCATTPRRRRWKSTRDARPRRRRAPARRAPLRRSTWQHHLRAVREGDLRRQRPLHPLRWHRGRTTGPAQDPQPGRVVGTYVLPPPALELEIVGATATLGGVSLGWTVEQLGQAIGAGLPRSCSG